MPTIVTFNLCNFGADASSARLRQLGAIIAQELAGPDILAVQEVKGEGPAGAEGPVPADPAYQTLIAAVAAAGVRATPFGRSRRWPTGTAAWLARISGSGCCSTRRPWISRPGAPPARGQHRYPPQWR